MSAPVPEKGWRGFHLFYHGDQDRLLGSLVRPLAAGLVAEGGIGRFFCIRYPLGGPHVRLRVEVDPAHGEWVAARVREAAAGFFARHPSATPLSAEKIQRENRGVIAEDPFASEADDVVFADNSVVEFPLYVEVDRYGGAALYGHSLDFFVLSTLEALRFVEEHGGAPAGRRMAGAARLLVRQAWGLAADAEELAALASYAVGTLGKRLGGLLPAADAAFARSPDAMCSLVRSELTALAASPESAPPAGAARALAHETRAADARERRTIATGQMHMTANRIGLRNGEELYLCRMLARAMAEVREAEPGFWREACQAHREGADAPVRPLRDRVAAALTELAGEAALAPAC